jgi:hypothetical protein
MLSLRSALAYKYNPTVKYNVELYRRGDAEIGELRVSMRTQNAGLILYMTEFYRLWSTVEAQYRGHIPFASSEGKYARKLILQNLSGAREIDLGEVIAAYVQAFDQALKAFFCHIQFLDKGALETEMIYRDYLAKNNILI